VLDSATLRGVPLVRLATSGYLSFYSDSAGLVAFEEPGLLGLAVFFYVTSDGYVNAHNMPGSPQQGVLLNTQPGGNATIYLNRTQPAERLYRLTGGGLYRDSLLVGAKAPVAEPLLSSAGVMGQDSLMGAVYKGKSYWLFGDTECPQGPRNSDCQRYGMFTAGATAEISLESRQPPSLVYFTSTDASAPGGMGGKGLPDAASIARWNPYNFSHPKAMLPGPGVTPNYADNTWVGSLTILTENQTERMYLTYVCPSTNLQGLALWSDEKEVFEPIKGPGYAMRYSGAQWVQSSRGEDQGHAYYASAFATVRVKSSFSAIEDPRQYEYYTPCGEGTDCTHSMSNASWGWKQSDLGGPGVGLFGPAEEAAAIKAGYLQPSDARMQVSDRATGKPLAGMLSRGSVNWNPHRQVYVLVADQTLPSPYAAEAGNPSRYGEIWYCESTSITGPWRECDRVITHSLTGASCYNPQQLPWMDEQGGRYIYIACTWTSMASSGQGNTDRVCAYDEYGGKGCALAVPRYEYNNVVFRLDTDNTAAPVIH